MSIFILICFFDKKTLTVKTLLTVSLFVYCCIIYSNVGDAITVQWHFIIWINIFLKLQHNLYSYTRKLRHLSQRRLLRKNSNLKFIYNKYGMVYGKLGLSCLQWDFGSLLDQLIQGGFLHTSFSRNLQKGNHMLKWFLILDLLPFCFFFKFFVLHFSFQHFLLSFGRLWPHGLMTLQTIIFITTRHYNLINPWPYDLMNYDFHNHMTLCNCNLIVSWRHNHMKLWYYDLITTWTHN